MKSMTWSDAIQGCLLVLVLLVPGCCAFLALLFWPGCVDRKGSPVPIDGVVVTCAEGDASVMLHSYGTNPDPRYRPLAGAVVECYADFKCTIEIPGATAVSDANGQYHIVLQPEAIAGLGDFHLVIRYGQKVLITRQILFGTFADYHKNTVVVPAKLVAEQ